MGLSCVQVWPQRSLIKEVIQNQLNSLNNNNMAVCSLPQPRNAQHARRWWILRPSGFPTVSTTGTPSRSASSAPAAPSAWWARGSWLCRASFSAPWSARRKPWLRGPKRHSPSFPQAGFSCEPDQRKLTGAVIFGGTTGTVSGSNFCCSGSSLP